jgi:elongation factor G
MASKPNALIQIAIEPKTASDAETLAEGLKTAARDFPLLEVQTDAESGQTILGGSSEDFLTRVLAALGENIFRVGAPQVAYREGLTKTITLDYTHKKILSGRGEFARVVIRFEPLPDGMGVVFENATLPEVLPSAFVEGVEKGIRAQAKSGLIAGFPVTDFQATLLDGAYHEVDSSLRTFDIAARVAFRALRDQGALQLLEPIMSAEVATPEYFLGGVIGDINSRRGMVHGTTDGEIFCLVQAKVPLANMFGYGASLQTMSQGRATFAMEFSHYAPVDQPSGPDDVFPGAMAMRA